MPIHNLVQACHSKISWNGRCPDCGNDGCQGNCGKCLEEIHSRTQNRRYCGNLVNYYVCKHIYRYASEIEYLLTATGMNISVPSWNVVSVGCGPCSELFGSIAYLSKHCSSTPMVYNGFDLNTKWQSVHNEIRTIFNLLVTGVTIDFHYIDLFKYLKAFTPPTTNSPINVLFLQYVISDMQQHNYDIKSFLELLTITVIDRMPSNSIIVVNDINHDTYARNYFGDLLRLVNKNNKVNCYTYYFEYDGMYPPQRYGIMHSNNAILYSLPTFWYKYSTWSTCKSVQMLIHKVG